MRTNSMMSVLSCLSLVGGVWFIISYYGQFKDSMNYSSTLRNADSEWTDKPHLPTQATNCGLFPWWVCLGSVVFQTTSVISVCVRDNLGFYGILQSHPKNMVSAMWSILFLLRLTSRNAQRVLHRRRTPHSKIEARAHLDVDMIWTNVMPSVHLDMIMGTIQSFRLLLPATY